MADFKSGFVSGEVMHTPLTTDQMKELALDCHAGKIFGSWMIPERDIGLISNIFMVTLFLTPIQRKTMQRDHVAHFYEYRSEANMAINGYPIFMSAHMLTEDEMVRLRATVKKIDDAMKVIDGE